MSQLLYPGVALRAGGHCFTISEIAGPERIVLQLNGSNDFRILSEPELLQGLESGLVQITPKDEVSGAANSLLLSEDDRIISSVPESLRSDAAVRDWLAKKRWIQRLHQKGFLSLRPCLEIEQVVKDLEHEHGECCEYSIHTLYQDDRKVLASDGDWRAIFPNYDLRGGRNGTRLPIQVEKLITERLEEAANNLQDKLVVTKIYDDVINRVTELSRTDKASQIYPPSLPTVRRRFCERFSPYEVAARKYGRERANEKFRNNGARVTAQYALDVVEFDDVDSSVFLVDQNGLPWGRANITMGVDQNTDAPMGFSMGPQPRSRETALEAVMHAIFPKDHSDPDLQACANRWEFYGQIGSALFDNASYNACVSLEAQLLELWIELVFARPHTPTNKSGIEHFNWQLKADHLSSECGWAGPKEDREMLDRGIAGAVMDLAQFRKRLIKWIVDVYANRPSLIDGMSTRQRWQKQLCDGTPCLPKYQPSQELLGTVIRPEGLKFRDSGGFLRMGLRYQSEEASELMRRVGKKEKMVVRYKPNDLRYLYVQNPINRLYFKVPCIEDPRYVNGLTNYQQQLILKYARRMKFQNPSIEQLCTAREGLIADVEQQRQSKKLTERKLGVVVPTPIPAVEADSKKSKPQEPKAYVMSQVERGVEEVDAVEIPEDEEMALELF